MSPSPSRRVTNGSSDVDIEAAKPERIASDPDLRLTQTNTIGGMTISPELFEKLYLTPKVPKAGFANPTPMGFVGFVISTFTFVSVMRTVPCYDLRGMR